MPYSRVCLNVSGLSTLSFIDVFLHFHRRALAERAKARAIPRARCHVPKGRGMGMPTDGSGRTVSVIFAVAVEEEETIPARIAHNN